ncbi:MAG: hypothetical protein FWE70_02470 [Oscillospiraceae bacterium]|nr:hypothetical protein [Oscillospiraceae bacterium]
MAWTKLDRVLAALSGERPDRPPIFDYLIHDGVFELCLGRPVVPGEREAILRASSRVLDLCHPMPVAYEPHEEELPYGGRKVVERWMVWNAHGRRPESEVVGSVKDDIDRLTAGTHWIQGGYGEGWRSEDERRHAWSGDMAYISLGLHVPMLPGRTFEEEFFTLADHPGLCGEWHALQTRACMANTEARAAAGLSKVAIIWNDIAIKGGLIYPPHVLERFFYPGLREMVSILHGHGVKAIFHSDGDVTGIMDELASCGIDGFNPLEVSAGMEARHFFERYGDRVTLVGGLDAVDVLAFGTPAEVADATRALIKEAGPGGRLIMGSSSGQLDGGMPLENLMAYIGAVWGMGAGELEDALRAQTA